jgi:hypothetical protein
MSEKTFNVRDFIMPPYKTCPKCGQETFGVLNIDRNRYSRRCQNCLHMVDRFPLPKLNKRIIYLDQYVVSNLMKLENPEHQRNDRVTADRFWQELRSLLRELRSLQLIVCPDSGSHVSESRISPFNAELKKMYEHLSGGITFNSFDGIRSQQIGELARAWSEGRDPHFEFDPGEVLTEDPNQWSKRYYITFQDNPFIIPDEIKAERAFAHATIARLFRDVWSKEKRTYQQWYDAERNGYQRNLARGAAHAIQERIKMMRTLRPDVEPSLAQLGTMMRSPAEVLLRNVQHILTYMPDGKERSPEENTALQKSFAEANRIAEAPFVKLQSMMYAAIAMRAAAGQKEPPNEGMTTDVETVAHLLPYCDAMLMDNDCRALLLNIPLSVRPPEAARVYSLNTRNDFLEYLRSLRTLVTPEHRQALLDVYGEEYIKG